VTGTPFTRWCIRRSKTAAKLAIPHCVAMIPTSGETLGVLYQAEALGLLDGPVEVQ
jgi:hypothetical protein